MVDIETATNQMIGQLNGMSDRIEKFVDDRNIIISGRSEVFNDTGSPGNHS